NAIAIGGRPDLNLGLLEGVVGDQRAQQPPRQARREIVVEKNSLKPPAVKLKKPRRLIQPERSVHCGAIDPSIPCSTREIPCSRLKIRCSMSRESGENRRDSSGLDREIG